MAMRENRSHDAACHSAPMPPRAPASTASRCRPMRISAQMQRRLCQKWSADYVPVDPAHKIGIAGDVGSAGNPINGLRHPPEGDTSGWYIWAGEEMGTADDYF